MNKVPYRQTQAGKVIEAIKLAYLSGVPIVYLATDEMELINDILYNPDGCIIPNFAYNPSERKLAFLNREERKECAEFNFFYNGLASTGYSDKPYISVFLRPDKLDEKDLARNSPIMNFINNRFDLGRNISKETGCKKSIIIILCPDTEIPKVIAPYTEIIYVDPLSDDEIREIIHTTWEDNGVRLRESDENVVNQMIISFRGFRKRVIEQVLKKMIISEYIDFSGIINRDTVFDLIRAEKKQLLEKNGALKWEDTTGEEASGMDAISHWLDERINIFADIEKAKMQDIDVPKGILMSGIPGSGKSLMAKYAAYKLKLPLISLDMGALLGKYVGESEHNMICALKMAEQMSPCVLWIDEIEKAFSGAKSDGRDSGVGLRMFGKFLTWMQEKKAACFVFATSNDITVLPPELFRSERFDRKYFTFMPTLEECCRIFAGNIGYQNRLFKSKADKSNRNHFVEKSLFASEMEDDVFWKSILEDTCTLPDGCELNEQDYKWKDNRKPKNKLLTGADISAIVKEAKFRVYSDGKTNTTNGCVYGAKEMSEAIKKVIRKFKPYGETNLKSIVRCFLKLYENVFESASSVVKPPLEVEGKLYENEFESASGQCIINFENYDEDRHCYIPKKEEQYLQEKGYNGVLFKTIVGAINQYAEDIAGEGKGHIKG